MFEMMPWVLAFIIKLKRIQTLEEPSNHSLTLVLTCLAKLTGRENFSIFSHSQNQNFAWLPRPAEAWGCSAGEWVGDQKALAWNSGKFFHKSKVIEPARFQSGATSSISEGLVSLSHWPLCLSRINCCDHEVCWWGQAVCHCSLSCYTLVH